MLANIELYQLGFLADCFCFHDFDHRMAFSRSRSILTQFYMSKSMDALISDKIILYKLTFALLFCFKSTVEGK